MRCCGIALAVLLTLALLVPSLHAQGGNVQGLATAITKDKKTPTGTITVSVNGNNITFVVNEFTYFEVVRGDDYRRANFLVEHRGEQVVVYPLQGVNPLTAAKVQIIRPALPYVYRGPPRPGHHHGIVTDLSNNAVTIRLDHRDPPPPAFGKISDVQYDQDKGLGSITITPIPLATATTAQKGAAKTPKGPTPKSGAAVAGGPNSYTITAATAIYSVNGLDWQRRNFLDVQNNQTVLIFLNPYKPTVATKIDILQDPSQANQLANQQHHNQLVSYLLNATVVEAVRDGKHTASTVSALTVGQHISILPTGVYSHIAQHVDILLPHAVHGEVAGLAAGVLNVKVKQAVKTPSGSTTPVKKNTGAAAKGTTTEISLVSIPLTAGTGFATVDKTVQTPASLAAIRPGTRVVVFPGGVPPYAADRVEIHHGKGHTTRGMVVGVNAQGMLMVKVHHAAKGDKPATDTVDTFQIAPTSRIETLQGGMHIATNMTALQTAKEVVVHHGISAPSVVDRIEIRSSKDTKIVKKKTK